VPFEDFRDRRSRDPVPQVAQRALDSCVAPSGILLGHPDRQVLNLLQNAGTSHTASRVRPLARDQLAMPPQNRIGRDDRRHLPQHAPPETVALGCQPPPLIRAQPETTPTHLRLQDLVLSSEVVNDVKLPPIHPVGCTNLVTPQGRIRESHHQADRDAGRKRRPMWALRDVLAGAE
jgi:hypothetical protein